MLGVKPILLLGELGADLLDRLLRRRLGLVLAGEGWVELVQLELFARLDAELLAVIQGCGPPPA